MIAKNFYRYPEAQLAQMELDLAGVLEASPEQRHAWWTWLLRTCAITRPSRPVAPKWLVAMKRRARTLANSVRAALLRLFLKI